MTRFVTAKRAAVAATATGAAAIALVAGTTGSATAAHQEATAPPSLTLNFSANNDEANAANALGAGFGGSATVTDSAGKAVGTAYDMCDKDGISAKQVTAFCHADVVFDNGDQVALSVVFPIQDPVTATYPQSFDGVVTGGTGAYKGLTGAAHFTNTALAVYTVSWDV
ncbi:MULTISPECIES: hypothetical protein [Streptomycetaceae]|jgi:hypothetical protein|uniref:hypothetical protein n=1 Tax=Streptomycetaceae TaxID=2062 RepID=UPI00300A447A